MNLIEQEPQPASPSYREIPLTRGQVALVDTADHEWLMQWKWHARWNRDTQSFYATRNSRKADGKPRIPVWMHREILGLPRRSDGRIGDHIESGQTLDNRRSNLRIVTSSQNNINARVRRDNPVGIKGIYRFRNGKWGAKIQANKSIKFLGYFFTQEEAAAAYRKAANELHGEFAYRG